MKINASHFKTMEELIRHINMCVKDEDIFALERYVGLNELDILVKEIARLNKIIDELEKYLKETYNHFMYDNCEEILHNKPEEMEKYGFMYNLGSIHDKANIIEIIRKKLKELKEEGKFQEIPLFEGTMEQLDNLTILKEEGNKDK